MSVDAVPPDLVVCAFLSSAGSLYRCLRLFMGAPTPGFTRFTLVDQWSASHHAVVYSMACRSSKACTECLGCFGVFGASWQCNKHSVLYGGLFSRKSGPSRASVQNTAKTRRVPQVELNWFKDSGQHTLNINCLLLPLTTRPPDPQSPSSPPYPPLLDPKLS